jgi:hypothetical protein
MSSHLIQFARFCEVAAIGQMAHFCHLCYEAKEMNKTQILMDKISTLSWINIMKFQYTIKIIREITLKLLFHS